MQLTLATIITSFRSKRAEVAECLSLSISSFTDESFQYRYRSEVHKPLADSNRNMIQNILQHY